MTPFVRHAASSSPIVGRVRCAYEIPAPAPVRAALPRLAARHGLLLRREEDESGRETYLDTPDRRIHRAGYCLGFRNGAGRGDLRLEPLRGGPGRALEGSRLPWEGPRRTRAGESLSIEDLGAPGAGADPTPTLVDRLLALAGREPLRPILDLRIRIERWTVRRSGRPVGRIALVEASPLREGKVIPRPGYRVEVEARSDDPYLVALIEELRVEATLTNVARTRYESLSARLGDPAPPDLGPSDPTVTRTAAERAFASLRDLFGRYLAAEPGARLGEDPLELKSMRIAARRLRSALRVWRGVVPGAGRYAPELRRLERRLGAVRDLDVALAELEAWARSGGPPRPVVDLLRRRLGVRRNEARRRLLAALDGRRHRRLVRRFSRALRRGPKGKRGRDRALRHAAPELRRLARVVRKRGDRARRSGEPGPAHRLRRDARRLRYALELHLDLLGKPGAKMVGRLVALQANLGDRQDSEVSLDRIRALLDDPDVAGSPEARESLRAWAAELRERGRRRRAEFPEVWSGLRGRTWKRWKRRLGRSGRPRNREASA